MIPLLVAIFSKWGCLGGQRQWIPVEMGLKEVVSLMWVMGIELGSSERAVCTANLEPSLQFQAQRPIFMFTLTIPAIIPESAC